MSHESSPVATSESLGNDYETSLADARKLFAENDTRREAVQQELDAIIAESSAQPNQDRDIAIAEVQRELRQTDKRTSVLKAQFPEERKVIVAEKLFFESVISSMQSIQYWKGKFEFSITVPERRLIRLPHFLHWNFKSVLRKECSVCWHFLQTIPISIRFFLKPSIQDASSGYFSKNLRKFITGTF